ncbi:MAG: hypothetical protein IJG62_07325 [Synergistaceae bacterium]|nr:hypothetical protein [Synergistaceae bacterium]MBQ4419860.1 hypothetical protein [Synergistaceae bacterium]MBQ6739334.1 hypothetical protein [Synergistaceae bacterium]MBQ6909286.1 hypothetical protein [Synergistaceae bacterium]MBQ9581557.1 hypothetical protein [Synergistaceae bacterium]
MNINKSIINKFISRWHSRVDEKSGTQNFGLKFCVISSALNRLNSLRDYT